MDRYLTTKPLMYNLERDVSYQISRVSHMSYYIPNADPYRRAYTPDTVVHSIVGGLFCYYMAFPATYDNYTRILHKSLIHSVRAASPLLIFNFFFFLLRCEFFRCRKYLYFKWCTLYTLLLRVMLWLSNFM